MSREEVHPRIYDESPYMSMLVEATEPLNHRVLVGVPMTGLIRAEWALARWGQIIPTNWSQSECIHMLNQLTPLRYNVADARNIIVHHAVTQGFEWVLFIDHDVILPPDTLVRMNQYMRDGKHPVVAGLYFAKCHPPEPLVYRGRGNSYYGDWTLGDTVWVDGVPMGCTLINGKLLASMWHEAPEYVAGGNQRVRQVFDTPQISWVDPEMHGVRTFQGTEDLAWCNRVIKGEFLKKAGFPAIARRRYPFLIDTGIFCWHITEHGVKYPLSLEW